MMSPIMSKRTPWPVLALAMLLLTLVLRTPLDHDEGQYVAATHLVANGLMPYRDFPYLQTPLQPLLLAPVDWLSPGWLLIASRLANLLMTVIATLAIGWAAVRRTGDVRAGVLAMLLASICDPLLYAGSVARNDALPLMLLSLTLALAVDRPMPWRPARAFFIGLLAVAAAAAKVSYALPAAAILGQALWQARSGPRRSSALALAAGALLAFLPVAVFALAAPRAFLFQSYRYALMAVPAWATLKGAMWQLWLPVRVGQWALGMVQGPMLAMLFAGIILQWRKGANPDQSDSMLAVGPVVAAAWLATILPMPSLRQYLVPLIPPLVVWFVALAWPTLQDAGGWTLQRGWRRVFTAAAVAGLAGSVLTIVHPGSPESPMAVEREAHRIGDQMRMNDVATLATLEPVRAVDSGMTLDPRFATGQFLFRAGNVQSCADPRLCPVTFASMRQLDLAPPGAVLTGTQHKQPRAISGGLDGALDRWAASHHYRSIWLDPIDRLWLAPARQGRAGTA